MTDAVVTPAAASALYPDGGANPEGHKELIQDPRAAGTPPAPAAAAEAPKPAEAAPTAEAPKAEEAPAPAAKPDPASYDLKFSENFQVDDAILGEFKTTAAELGLTPDAAQKLMPLYEKALTAAIGKVSASAQETFTTQQADWTKELNSFPELQGDARERTAGLLGRLIDEFGSSEVKTYLNSTGAGNNPAIVRMMINLATALIEGEPTPAGGPANLDANKGKGARQSGGQILYGGADRPN